MFHLYNKYSAVNHAICICRHYIILYQVLEVRQRDVIETPHSLSEGSDDSSVGCVVG